MSTTPSLAEIQLFSNKIKIDLADCYLALPRIQKWGLSLDHPRAGKLARAEANRSIRSEWAGGGVTMPPLDGRAATVDSDSAADGLDAVHLDESRMAERFRTKPTKDKKWAMAAIHAEDAAPITPIGKLVEKEEERERVANGLPADRAEALAVAREAQKKEALRLGGALKPRDRPILDLYMGQGLKITQVAEKLGKKPKTVYASVARMGKPMRAEKLRREWVEEHCSIDQLAGGVESARIVLDKAGQLGWELEVQP